MSSHMLSQCHDPNQPHILGPIITGSLTDVGSLWPCDQRAHGLAICHREGEVRRPRHPETLWLGPDPKNGQWTHPDPATVADTLRGCTAWGSDVDTLTASVSRSTQEHTALLSARTHTASCTVQHTSATWSQCGLVSARAAGSHGRSWRGQEAGIWVTGR